MSSHRGKVRVKMTEGGKFTLTSKKMAMKYAYGHEIRASSACAQPVTTFNAILSARGYDTGVIRIEGLNSSYNRKPTLQQLQHYDNHTINAVRKSDLDALTTLVELGRSMDACNSHCESLLHMACRISSLEVVFFMLKNGATVMVDDYGRTPLHDLCWRCTPDFQLVQMLLDFDSDMMFVTDRYKACPLQYVTPSEWVRWSHFLDTVKDEYWPHIQTPGNAAITRGSQQSVQNWTVEGLSHAFTGATDIESAYGC